MNKKQPTTEIFNEMKKIAISIWQTYDDSYGYASEKITRINSLDNIEDNAMVFYRMFDPVNQAKFRQEASNETLKYIKNNQ